MQSPAAAMSAARCPQRARVVCSAVCGPQREAPQLVAPGRRALLSGAALLAASWQAQQSLAYGNWDGESAAIGSCPLGEAGEECRIAQLSRDKGKLGSYGAATDNRDRVGRSYTSGGTNPVATLDAKYKADTLELSDLILAYAALDLYDPERVAVIKQIKADAPGWVSRYARGGSARTLSARRFYIVVDAISGHLASNGAAPFPASKLKELVSKVREALALLEEGK